MIVAKNPFCSCNSQVSIVKSKLSFQALRIPIPSPLQHPLYHLPGATQPTPPHLPTYPNTFPSIPSHKKPPYPPRGGLRPAKGKRKMEGRVSGGLGGRVIDRCLRRSLSQFSREPPSPFFSLLIYFFCSVFLPSFPGNGGKWSANLFFLFVEEGNEGGREGIAFAPSRQLTTPLHPSTQI